MQQLEIVVAVKRSVNLAKPKINILTFNIN